MQAEEESGDVASVDGSGDLHPASGGDIGVGAGHSAEQQLHPGPRRCAQVRMRLHGVLELRHEVQLDQELQLHYLFVLRTSKKPEHMAVITVQNYQFIKHPATCHQHKINAISSLNLSFCHQPPWV